MLQHLHDAAADIAISIVFGMAGGLLYYLSAIEEGKVFKWRTCILQMATSGFCGVITFICFVHLAGFSPDVCAAFSGISGWMGNRGLKLIEDGLKKRAGINE